MKRIALLFAWLGLFGLAACGPNIQIPSGHNADTSQGGITTAGITSDGNGYIPLHSNNGGGNPNAAIIPSTAVGTVSLTGSINGNTFVAQDAVFGLSQTSGGRIVLEAVIGDQPHLCQYLAAQTGPANLVIVLISSTNPNTYPTAATYPAVDPNGTIPDAVATDGGFSEIAFAAVGASVGTFANAGQVQVTTSATNPTDSEAMTIQATDAAKDAITGTFTPAFCNVLGGG